MTSGVTARRRDLPLTVSAALGALVAVALVVLGATHTRPVAFRSGSMSPTIPTGGAALVHRVPAAELQVGDVVTVPSGDTFVTHRIVQLTRGEGVAMLQLKGDANRVADPSLYRVGSAERVVASAPWVGYALGGIGGPAGLFLGAVYVLWLLRRLVSGVPAPATGPRPRHRGGGRRRATPRLLVGGTLMAVAVAGIGVAGAPRALAVGWGDSAAVTGPSLAVYKLVSPPGEVGCANGSAGSGKLTLSWAAPAGAPAGYGYQVEVWTKDTLLTNPVLLASFTLTATQLEIEHSQLNRPFLWSGTAEVFVRGYLPTGGWRSSTSTVRTIRVGLSGLDYRC